MSRSNCASFDSVKIDKFREIVFRLIPTNYLHGRMLNDKSFIPKSTQADKKGKRKDNPLALIEALKKCSRLDRMQ